MSCLSDILPPQEAHVVRTVLTGIRNWCVAHGEAPEEAQTHAALDATTWVHAFLDGTLEVVAIEPIVIKEDPRTTAYRQMRLGGEAA
jgi:hypothetical protein